MEQFVFRYCYKKDANGCPLYYVIGNLKKQHDFAIVLPSLDFHQKWRFNKKIPKKEAKGDVVYSRPFFTPTCLFA